MEEINEKRNYSIAQAAKLLGKSSRTVYYWCKDGFINWSMSAQCDKGKMFIKGKELARIRRVSV